ncbi:hypothetical protein ABZ671_29490 [Micromonospora sp. NPDC006766]|uniref:hypothetical protein n=1 Tax=Micromonospora sp. NPDC006766 TaxID=3154778 RepID=UPI0033CE30F0
MSTDPAGPPPAPLPVPAQVPSSPDWAEKPRGIRQAGTDVAANAQQPGQAAETNSLRREAEVVFASGGTFFGSAASVQSVSGNQYVYHVTSPGGRSTTLYSIDPAQTRLLREAFVADTAYAALLGRSRTRSVVILQAARGTGRSATAQRLLLDNHQTEIFSFAPDVPIGDVATTMIKAGGYLIEEIDDTRARALTTLALNDLDAKLGALGAKLIITMAAGLTLSDPGLQSFVIRIDQPPSHRSIMESHLRYRLGDARADNLLSRPDFCAVFDDTVTSDSARDRAAQFAVHVEELMARGQLELGLLRSRMKSSVAGEVESWFDGLATPSLKYLAIAVALLDGLPYQSVVEPAESLERRLTRPTASTPAPTAAAVDPFATGRTHRVRQIRAEVVRSEITTRFGRVPAEIIRYLDPAYPRAVIELVWREYDGLRRDLLGWLGDLANHPVDAVRVRAAAAIGLISTTAFDYISKIVLRPWANDSKDSKREMAAFALRAAGRSHKLQQQALTLVGEWITSRSWQLNATAARVYGSALGSAMPDRAFRELDRLSRTEYADVAFAISYSLAELTEADHRQALPATDLSVKWMRSQHQGQSATGEIAFLTLAADLVGAADAGPVRWPLLLQLARTDRGLSHAVAAAWDFTLNGAMFHRFAQDIAGSWAERVEPDEQARQALALMLASVCAGSERTEKLVRHMVRGWMSKPGTAQAPQTAQAVLAVLI